MRERLQRGVVQDRGGVLDLALPVGDVVLRDLRCGHLALALALGALGGLTVALRLLRPLAVAVGAGWTRTFSVSPFSWRMVRVAITGVFFCSPVSGSMTGTIA